MKYLICWKDAFFDFLDGVQSRSDAVAVVRRLMLRGSIQRFSSRYSGCVFGYCAEITDSGKEVGILIDHKPAGLIWANLA